MANKRRPVQQEKLLNLIADRMSTWHKILACLVALFVVGSSFAWFERTYGPTAGILGFLRWHDMIVHKADHKRVTDQISADVVDIQLWQLFNNIKRLEREIEDYEAKGDRNWRDNDRLKDLRQQLKDTQAEYDMKKKRSRERALQTSIPDERAADQ